MIPLPDLLHPRAHALRDNELLHELLEMAFLGSNESRAIDRVVGELPVRPSTWTPEFFLEDLFVDDLLRPYATVHVVDRDQRMHLPFVKRVLSQPPVDLETIRLRQGILRELETSPEIRAAADSLYNELVALSDLIKSCYSKALLDNVPQRLQVLRQARSVIDQMTVELAPASSGLRRIADVGREIKKTPIYEILAALLDWEDRLADVELKIQVGANGRIRKLEIHGIAENRDNRFHKAPWRRWIEVMRLYWRGYGMSTHEVVNRVVLDVYRQLIPALSSLVQLIGHLEVYLVSRAFADRARARGLEVCLAELREGGTMAIRDLFNPLLMEQAEPTVPCDIETADESIVVIVTGPNSGGKTRLLQALGIAQMLGQSGLYTSAREARLAAVQGTFASLVYRQTADQLEGRLGTELVRIRGLFNAVNSRSLILLDELCSGTNPSEATEIVNIVLRLLPKLDPVAYITTHFLDLAKELAADVRLDGLDFLQVEVDGDHEPTYRFVPGVASTSMAASTAHRLGVDFEQLSCLIDERQTDSVAESVKHSE